MIIFFFLLLLLLLLLLFLLFFIFLIFQKFEKLIKDIIRRFLSWRFGWRIFTFGNVSRDTSFIIGKVWFENLLYSHFNWTISKYEDLLNFLFLLLLIFLYYSWPLPLQYISMLIDFFFNIKYMQKKKTAKKQANQSYFFFCFDTNLYFKRIFEFGILNLNFCYL